MESTNACDAIEKINEFNRFGSVLGLERMNILLGKLGNPQDDLKVIHVAGTNGKGSICKYIYSVLQENGYEVGLFTSPFIEVFNERIEFDGEYISDEDLASFTELVLGKVNEMVEEGNQSPTEFEVVTAIAFAYFAKKNPDYVVLEVGLGGKGDSTNVVQKPLVSVIASISLDHTDRLGDTITKIAGEKAGIIKTGCPVVTTSKNPEALQVINQVAKDRGCKVFETRDTKFSIEREDIGCYGFIADILNKEYSGVELSMMGEHQVENAIGALTALEVLRTYYSVDLDDEKILNGMSMATQKGRFEIIQKNPYIILDGAHNPDGAKVLMETVNRHFAGKRILMVTGMLADKDTENIVEYFTEITDKFIATEPDSPRKMDAEVLAKKLTKKGCTCIVEEDPLKACKEAQAMAKDYDLVLFGGSLYLIGAIRGFIKC